MSAPRPLETDPFHPHSSVRILLLVLLEYICKSVSIISSMWYVQNCLSVLYIGICACAVAGQLNLNFKLFWLPFCAYFCVKSLAVKSTDKQMTHSTTIKTQANSDGA